ncbi:MAG TPA: leucine-rich repeat domain-containing protein [Clostridiaceae bacterium]|nr:leucine-rich repeat domain-containing protein [Clostridiaceae bacterium]
MPELLKERRISCERGTENISLNYKLLYLREVFSMRKTLFVLLALLLALGLAACGAPVSTETPSPEVSESASEKTSEPTVEPTPEPTPETAPEVVVFTDEVLEEKVQAAMNKPSGDITLAESEAVTELDLSIEPGTPLPRIKDISSLKYFKNLTVLKLAWSFDDKAEVDISPLAGMTKLIALYINSNGITDISALSGMTEGLCRLYLDENQITDITPIAGMKKADITKACGQPYRGFFTACGHLSEPDGKGL